jgi:D-arabinose 1-dehydrogenase-like Zn-dependent alcohol dehydrogenase
MPEPGPGQVQVQIHAAAMNRLDVWVRNGWPGIHLKYPHIPGADGAGVVSVIGPGVTSCRVGDRVVINSNLSDGTCEFCLNGQDNMCVRWGLLGETARGTYAEYVVVPEQNGWPRRSISSSAAARWCSDGVGLITRGVAARQSILTGVGGGINYAMQIAKYWLKVYGWFEHGEVSVLRAGADN